MNTATSDQMDGSTTALVIVDLQNNVINSDLAPYSGDQIVEKAERLVTAMRAAGGTVVFVRHNTLPNNADGQKIVADRSPGSGSGKKEPKAAGWNDISDVLTKDENDPIVTKRTFNAFYGTDLDLQLRRRGIQTIVLAGVTTNFGVEGTARNGLDHGYKIIVAEDACTSISKEMHEISINEVLPYLARIRQVSEIEALLAQ